ncbi:hypothetical protein [Streptococcus equi]|nr:hypothetical protein [Streptococcus equi]VED85398.1 Uncharacterised protein [Streptococcus equi subsp. equi]KIS14816.1 hypothetical protein AT48_01314 [Streptococcus equi subsp. zooepidemicus SzAM60]MDI5901661.1 hypothetical protein [Streptococcus equi subsp. zooepidemicus]MDI5930390.1 hypothetical protein [Streptococcus equi subsp. zooepidemicus]MDI6029656.1 hypothetical protein [Streptococcus equi subsp. zooepidemicus]
MIYYLLFFYIIVCLAILVFNIGYLMKQALSRFCQANGKHK